MRLRNPYERIQRLIEILDLYPSETEIVKFLSRNIEPSGELCGASWLTLNPDGHLEYVALHGLHSNMDSTVIIKISDDNVVAEALRTGKSKIFEMASMYESYAEATHSEVLAKYLSGMALPLSNRAIVGFAFNRPVHELREFEDYFECIRLVLALWISKCNFKKSDIGKQRTLSDTNLNGRQTQILEMIREGKTNSVIAREIGYSESLIRQETIIIYKKLGVNGRAELLRSKNRKDKR